MFSFRLSKSFVDSYRIKPVNFGYPDAGGNKIGELTYIRTYSRKRDDGTKEKWVDTCERVINGMFSLQKDHCRNNRLPWDNSKAQRTAQDAYDRMFQFKWTPPGRGMAQMGSPLIMEQHKAESLNNCGFSSTADMTKEDPSMPFTFLMLASMNGIGIGFDQLGAKKNFRIYEPQGNEIYVVPDTREGWTDSLELLLNSYLKQNQPNYSFKYHEIRPKGSPISSFGGVASGPEPLENLHKNIVSLLGNRDSEILTATDIADIGNMIGVCVKQGNIRRSAQLLVGNIEDEDFLHLKDYESPIGQRREGWSNLSNNSVNVIVGEDLSRIIPGIAANGEPGVLWMDTTRNFGRLEDPADFKDHRVVGYNPCCEQPLESGELCTLVDLYLNNHETFEDFKKTLKVAYLYAKTVTLIPTTWPRTNAIMQRNRRIGTSVSGVADFADNRGLPELRSWLDKGFKEIRRLDVTYSEWLCVRESIRVTTVKPAGTTGLVAGTSPGIHWTPGGKFFIRTIRFDKSDPLVQLYRNAGYKVEPEVFDPENTVVIYLPVKSKAQRSEREVSIFEKASLAVLAQRYWSDNSVSVTVSFDPETEGRHVGTILSMYEGQLKTISFLPMLAEGAYPQMPYGRLTEEEWEEWTMNLFEIDFEPLYAGLGLEAIGEDGCTTDSCEVREFIKEATEAG